MVEREEKPIRVVDRRMFTPDGELRPGFEPEESTAPAPPPAPPRATIPPAAPAEPEPPAPAEAETGADPDSPQRGDEPPRSSAAGSDFARIVSSLATTAYSALGLLPDPATGGRHRDLAIARQMIDWLGVLELKTRGNLSFEETDLLSRALYELRLAYVEVGRGPTK